MMGTIPEWTEDTPIYTIGMVAEMLGIHPQMLRVYEREGLIKPRRNRRNLRVYSQKEVERVRLIVSLSHDLGVNLAGIEVILRLLDERKRWKEQLKEFVEKLRARWGESVPEPPFISEETALVPFEPVRLARRVRFAHSPEEKEAGR